MSKARRLVHEVAPTVVLLTMALALPVSVWALIRASDQNGTQAQIATQIALRDAARTATVLHNQLVNSCIRLNVLRATDNRSHEEDYLIDRVFYASTVGAMRHQRTARSRRLLRQFVPLVRGAVRGKSWIPLTDCAAAVALHGTGYRAPLPVRFSTRLPPASALDPGNAARLHPRGT